MLTKYLRENNVIGCSKGYLKRYELGLQTITVEMVRKYFASSNRFLEAYQQEGCDGDNVKIHERELKKIELLKKPQTVHRGAVITSDDEDDHDHEAQKIKRNRFKTFLKNYVAIPGTQSIPPVEAPVPMEVPGEPVANYNAMHLVPVTIQGTETIPLKEVPTEPAANYNAIHLEPVGLVEPAAINNVMHLEPVEEDMGLDEFANALDNFDFA